MSNTLAYAARRLFLDQGRHHGSFFDIPVASSEVGSIEFTFVWEDGRREGKNYRITVQDLNKSGGQGAMTLADCHRLFVYIRFPIGAC